MIVCNIYIPKGVCSSKMTFDIENNIIKDFVVERGCPGNLTGIKNLIKGMTVDDVIDKLEGISCGLRKTSCPDQIAMGLRLYKEKRNN